MKSMRMVLKTASCIAAAAVSAVLPLSTFGGVFTAAPLTAYADESAGDLYYAIEDDHAVITGCKQGVSDVEIPAALDGKSVTAIGDYAFNGSSITSIKIPDSVTTIGNYAFSMSTKLKSVTLPDSLQYIGIRAFEMCSSLAEVNFPDHMVEMSSMVFDSTPWITEQRQKDPLVIVNGNLIDGQAAKGDIVIPSSVTYVSAGAFTRNENITSVVFPSSIKKVKDNTFFYCSNLKSADVRYATEIESMAFAYCGKLSDLKLSGKLTKIDYYSFSDIEARANITVYGSKADWDKVDKNADDRFLNNASYTFDESFVPPAEDVEGDINKDGEFNTADLLLLNKWLLGTPDTELKDWKAGDFTKDEVLDIYDLVMMRKALISK